MSEEDVPVSEGADAGEGVSLTTLARDHAGLLVAGSLAAGAALAFALTPKATRRKLVERTVSAAAAAGEAGLKLGRQGAEKLEGLGEAIGENAGAARERAAKAAGEARSSGLELVRTAINLFAALRR